MRLPGLSESVWVVMFERSIKNHCPVQGLMAALESVEDSDKDPVTVIRRELLFFPIGTTIRLKFRKNGADRNTVIVRVAENVWLTMSKEEYSASLTSGPVDYLIKGLIFACKTMEVVSATGELRSA